MSFSLMIHGGAGAAPDDFKMAEHSLAASMTDVLNHGRAILSTGGSALEAVIACVQKLEDDPLYNAGYGASPNASGEFELDAAVMDGRDLKAGAVAAVKGIRNPVLLAKLVMDKTNHVFLSGDAAAQFGLAHGLAGVDKAYFEDSLKIKRIVQEPSGTVGAVARDVHGNVAAATSTGGFGRKMPGRIGDTPIIGAGTYADNESCAISCTGRGEDFIRSVFSRSFAAMIENGMTIAAASEAAMLNLQRRVNGAGGFIAVDHSGNIRAAHSTPVMRHGWIKHGGLSCVRLVADQNP